MNGRDLFSIAAIAVSTIAFVAPAALHAADTDDVTAASEGFYSALAVLDDGAAMQSVWANTDYVTFVGPRSKSVIVGWDDQKKYWMNANRLFSQRAVSLSDRHVHVDGHLAWEMGLETADVKLKDGAVRTTSNLVTNIYEQIDGHWLMVSHHAQPKPQ